MKVASHYTSIAYEYDNSIEMSDHAKKMEEEGWKVVSLSYFNLKARFRKNV